MLLLMYNLFTLRVSESESGKIKKILIQRSSSKRHFMLYMCCISSSSRNQHNNDEIWWWFRTINHKFNLFPMYCRDMCVVWVCLRETHATIYQCRRIPFINRVWVHARSLYVVTIDKTFRRIKRRDVCILCRAKFMIKKAMKLVVRCSNKYVWH